MYDELAASELLVVHEDVDLSLAATNDAYRIIRPRPIAFVSYPYEWSFSQLKDAALLTLEIQRRAVRRGVVLRDASAFNVQFDGARPVFIDTLSFGAYSEGEPWIAYRQFCEHFLAPLALMATTDVRLGLLHAQFSDGIPLGLARTLLGLRSWAGLGLFLHIYLHARAQTRHATDAVRSTRTPHLSRNGMERLINHLAETVEGLSWRPQGTVWAGYEHSHGYSPGAESAKQEIVRGFLHRLRPGVTLDIGANTGTFSRIAADVGSRVVAIDSDPGAVELNYLSLKRSASRSTLSILVDLLNPSPASGWAHAERLSLRERASADTVLALALIHHLTLSGNVPFSKVAEFLAELGSSLIIEFVPLEDPQAQRLIVSRRETTHTFTQQHFENVFQTHFDIAESRTLPGSDRRLYLMMRKQASA